MGRDADENESLRHFAHPDDFVFEFEDQKGPTVLLKGYQPPENILATAAGFVQHFSKRANMPSFEITYYCAGTKDRFSRIPARKLTEEELEGMKI